jgi:cytochrome P450
MTNAEERAGHYDPAPTGPPRPAVSPAAGTAPAAAVGVALSRPAGTGEWMASGYADVQAILADHRFEVPAVDDAGAAVGTISWLRASVSRFANGSEHERRRALAVGQLALLDPGELRRSSGQHASALLAGAGDRGARVDVMALAARHAPMAAMAERLGFADPDLAAEAVMAVAGGYFGTADPRIREAADAGTVRLVGMLDGLDLEIRVARIALIVQACDATAGLIGTTLHVLQDAPAESTSWPTDAVLNEVLRHSPPVRQSRRVARQQADLGRCEVSAGDTVICSVADANRDPVVFEQPDRFDPARSGPPSLTFGYGVRPCPGQPQALMLAAGAVDAVREHCAFLPGEPVDYLPSSPLRIPCRLVVVLR